MEKIIIRDAAEHNLKSVDIEIPHYCLTVVTGVSGSGKSSLVFDTLYREGERRYLETFSSYARQFLGKLTKPSVGHIYGLSAAISIDQRSAGRSPRSTVGTITELYDHLRLLFARLGIVSNRHVPKEILQPKSQLNHHHQEVEFPPLERRLFSFNSPYGACPVCKGLGVEDRIDVDLLVDDPAKTLRQGALRITTPTGYIIYSQVTMNVLNQVCEANGFNVDIPWQELTEEQRKVVLFGSDKIKIPFGKHTLESRLKWSGITAKPREEDYYKGIIPIMSTILNTKRNDNILRFARTMPCEACGGTRLRPEALAVEFRGKTIAQLAAMTLGELHTFFSNIEYTPQEEAVGKPISQAVLQRIKLLRELGLGYLTLDRESTTLSNGESRRLRLGSLVGGGLRGVTYVLDEPSVGLHQRDNEKLLNVLFNLRDNGNTMIVVEHDEDTMRRADWLVDIGPGAGVHGGEILFSGLPSTLQAPDVLIKNPLLEKSKTYAFLTGGDSIPLPTQKRRGNGKILQLSGAREHNLKNIDVPFRLGVLNVVCGVSGAGKSTLVHDILANYLKNYFYKTSVLQGKCKTIEGVENIDKIIEIDQAPIGRTPRSNPATYTKLFDHVRDLFSMQPEAKSRGWDKGRFSFNVKGGRCEACEGAGVQQIGMHFLGSVDVVCEECNGKRFNPETLEIRYKGKNIFEVLEMPIEDAVVFFKDHAKISRFLSALSQLGLGYVTLGQPATTLSGGEAQRIKLASELCKPSTGKTLYILDEPTTGLHRADIKVLLEILNQLVEKGNTVIAVEHHPDFIQYADWIIELGPGSGDGGGELVSLSESLSKDYFNSGIEQQQSIIDTGDTTGDLKQESNEAGRGQRDKTISSQSVEDSDLLKVKPFIRENIQLPIRFSGVSTHNLKNIDVQVPVNRLTVITGVSGSGKSSLAFDTIFAEGQQRYLSGYSTYARRLLANSTGVADFEECSGLMPTVAISQRVSLRNPRSTVGTMTEIYEYYRLLYSRFGEPYCPQCEIPLKDSRCTECGYTGQSKLTMSMFSFNHQQGACEECNGLGITRSCDPLKLVKHPERSLLEGAMGGTKTGDFYGDPYGQYVAILGTVGEEKGIDYSKPWDKLDEAAREIAMYGTGDLKYQVAWKYKRKNREGVHEFQTTWNGLVHYINEEYQRKHADKRGQAMLELMSDSVCPKCKGDRLKSEFLSVYFSGMTIAQLGKKTINESITFFEEVIAGTQPSPLNKGFYGGSRGAVFSKRAPLVKECTEILKGLFFLRDVGLGYITLDRKSSTLSGGEAQRIRLAGQLGAGLTNITYILDEPTIGLHSRDTGRLLSVLNNLKALGNTVIVVEHDEEMIRAADHIIDLGPVGGSGGGYIVAQGTVSEVEQNLQSKTGEYLREPETIPLPLQRRTMGEGIVITGANANNLKNFDIHIPVNGIVVLTGVSGSGKTSLMFEVIAASIERGEATGCRSISGLNVYSSIIPVDQKPVGAGSSGNPATYTGIFDILRDMYAKTSLAVQRGYKKNRFSFNVAGGRCEACQGAGRVKTSMDFLADVWSVCEECNGKRYNSDTLECEYKGKSIADILEMTVSEAVEFFVEEKEIVKILQMLVEVGLDYVQLGQSTNTLSGGESQRLKLAAQLMKGKGKKNLYLFDEPSTGLHFEDIKRLIALFHRLADAGHTLLIIEHQMDIIKNADYVIDLGPEGGDAGGHIVAEGIPETIVAVDSSHTAAILKTKIC